MTDRIRAWLNQPEIDRALAQGVRPAPGTALARRARRLNSRRSRRALARSIDRLVVDLDRHSAPCRRGPDLLNRTEVRRSHLALAQLAESLRQTNADVRTVATASWLLTGPDSPVYRDCPAGAIEAAIRDT